MKLLDPILWQPGTGARLGIVALAGASTFGVGYLHFLTGLAYEFHVLFILPLLLVAWYAGAAAGHAVAFLAVALWFLADRTLGGDQADSAPLLFNSAMRLTIFFGGVWLLARLRQVLERESRLAREDALTRLPNRREFHEQGRRALAQAQRQGAPFTAVFIDLDKFKQVNDEFGHEVGDELLIRVAAGLREHVRVGDIPGRLGGDEFALLLPGMDAAAAATYVERLRQRLLASMAGRGWPVTFSIGVASYRVAPDDLDAVLVTADGLMYEVKQGGRERIQQGGFSGGRAAAPPSVP